MGYDKKKKTIRALKYNIICNIVIRQITLTYKFIV